MIYKLKDSKRVIIEDGKVYDEERRKVLEAYGLREIRFKNSEVFNEFERVCREISEIPPVSPGGGDIGGISHPLPGGNRRGD